MLPEDEKDRGTGVLIISGRISSIKLHTFFPFSKTLTPRHLLLWAEHTVLHNQAEMFRSPGRFALKAALWETGGYMSFYMEFKSDSSIISSLDFEKCTTGHFGGLLGWRTEPALPTFLTGNTTLTASSQIQHTQWPVHSEEKLWYEISKTPRFVQTILNYSFINSNIFIYSKRAAHINYSLNSKLSSSKCMKEKIQETKHHRKMCISNADIADSNISHN